LKLVHAAAVSTTVIMVLGLIMIAPTFFRNATPDSQLKVMFTFSVLEVDNVSKWCKELADLLTAENVKATVFFTGRFAEQHPECVKAFGNLVDIGSQTYSYVNLTSISDYDVQLEEVEKGKEAVDRAGNLYSRLFKAPYGSTDENIYSLLSHSGIVADFSYQFQYNVFQNGQFIKFDSITYNGSELSSEFLTSLPKTTKPLIIAFGPSTSIARINEVMQSLKGTQVVFVNASEIAGCKLTQRGGSLA